MWEYANGIDNSEVHYKQELPKCVGNSVTLPRDVSDIQKLEEILLSLSEHVTYRLRKYGLLANVVNVQIRSNSFKDRSHQGKLDTATCSTKIIYNKAKELLEELHRGEEIRLVGLRVDNLTEKQEEQITFFSNQNIEKQEKLDAILDKLKNKYGYSSISRAGKMNVEEIVKYKKEN